MPDNETLKTLKAHHYTCLECGFKSRPHRQVLSGYMHVVNRLEKTEVLCELCYQVDKIYTGDIQTISGVMIYLPWMEQKDLINLSRLLMVCISRDDPVISNYASNLQSSLAENAHQLSLINPLLKGEIDTYVQMRLSAENVPNSINTINKVIRFLPDYVSCQHVIKYWDKSSFNQLSNERLVELLWNENSVTE